MFKKALLIAAPPLRRWSRFPAAAEARTRYYGGYAQPLLRQRATAISAVLRLCQQAYGYGYRSSGYYGQPALLRRPALLRPALLRPSRYALRQWHDRR